MGGLMRPAWQTRPDTSRPARARRSLPEQTQRESRITFCDIEIVLQRLAHPPQCLGKRVFQRHRGLPPQFAPRLLCIQRNSLYLACTRRRVLPGDRMTNNTLERGQELVQRCLNPRTDIVRAGGPCIASMLAWATSSTV